MRTLSGIEDTLLHFEIIPRKILPGYDLQRNLLPSLSLCPAVWIQSLWVWKKPKGCTGMLAERRGKLPGAYSIFSDIAIQLLVFTSAAFPDKV